MLFGNDKNKDILISFLNNILGFKGEKEIFDVEINSNELLGDSDKSVQSSVDILCTNKGKQKIAIEMQRVYEDYFLAREQEYMSKIISQQVTSGQSSKYHEVMLDTYVIVIAKNNIFPDRQIKDPNKMKKFQSVYDNDKSNSTKEIYYYKEVVPMIKGYNIEIPDNKMNWVFCELSKFKKQHKDDAIDGTFSIKEQWLDFLINASTREKAVENLNEIVKKGYEIMKSVLLSEDTRTLYWKEKRDKELHEKAKAEQEKEISDKAFFEGVEKGKLKGEIKGEISKIKNFIELEVPQEKFASKLHFLNEEKFKSNLDFNLNFSSFKK
jgi:predicted transposase/invertase (TIGR01784 family)